MIRIANKNARKYVVRKEEFGGSNTFARWTGPTFQCISSQKGTGLATKVSTLVPRLGINRNYAHMANLRGLVQRI